MASSKSLAVGFRFHSMLYKPEMPKDYYPWSAKGSDGITKPSRIVSMWTNRPLAEWFAWHKCLYIR